MTSSSSSSEEFCGNCRLHFDPADKDARVSEIVVVLATNGPSLGSSSSSFQQVKSDPDIEQSSNEAVQCSNTVVTVKTALLTIYNLELLDQVSHSDFEKSQKLHSKVVLSQEQDGHTNDSENISKPDQPHEGDQIAGDIWFCRGCANVLCNLYILYCELRQLRDHDSYLSTQIRRVDTIMEQVRDIWTNKKYYNHHQLNDTAAAAITTTTATNNHHNKSNNNETILVDLSSSSSRTLPVGHGPWVQLTRLTSGEIAAGSSSSRKSTRRKRSCHKYRRQSNVDGDYDDDGFVYSTIESVEAIDDDDDDYDSVMDLSAGDEADSDSMDTTVQSCQKCLKHFNNVQNLKSHQKICHGKRSRSKKNSNKKQFKDKTTKRPSSASVKTKTLKIKSKSATTTTRKGRLKGMEPKSSKRFLFTSAFAGSFKCTLCEDGDESFRHCRDMAEHLWTHVKDDDHGGGDDATEGSLCTEKTCPLCPIRLEPPKLKKHLKTHAAQMRGCPTCGKKFQTTYKMMRHLQTHLDNNNSNNKDGDDGQGGGGGGIVEIGNDGEKMEARFSCEECSQVFFFPSFLKAHKIKIHGHADNRTKKQNPTTMDCKHCDDRFSSGTLYRDHYTNVHPGLYPYPCRKTTNEGHQCYKEFFFQKQRDNHELTHDPIPSSGGGGDIQPVSSSSSSAGNKCPTCNKHIKETLLAEHVKSCKGNKGYPCTVCAKMCSKKNLTAHMNTHNTESADKLKCQLCNKHLSSGSSLRCHMRLHTGAKPFLCQFCQVSFAQAGQLKGHIRAVHFKEKSHLCPQCGKSFARAYGLQRHIARHGEERNYKCTVDPLNCNKCFKELEGLKNHEATHSEQNRRLCSICGKSLAVNHLRRHMRLHTGERPYKCGRCGWAGIDGRQLKRHQRNAHGVFSTRDTLDGVTTADVDMMDEDDDLEEEGYLVESSVNVYI